MKKLVDIKILSKKVSGLFWKTYTVFLEVLNQDKITVTSCEVPEEQFHYLQVNHKYTINMYQHEDGLWYFQ